MASSGHGLGDLPTDDRGVSPYTGWTRAHWEHVADGLLRGVQRFASPRHALIRVPGGRADQSRHIAGLEGFARTFLLAAYRLAGARGKAPGDLAARYARGLAAGTDPRSGEAWPQMEDGSQAIVEAALLALGLAETGPWIWDQLDRSSQERAVAWLSQINRSRVPPNNWVLFPVTVNAFLKSVGAPHDEHVVERNLDLVDSWYRADGWYTDGQAQNFDYYVGWALHFHTLNWCRLDGDRSDPSRAAVYRSRLRAFLEQYAYLFAGNGAPVYHGRSLTYRVAVAAPLFLGALVDASPLPPGRTRRLASGALRHFIEHGAVVDGRLTLGWHHEFLPMVQHYSGSGSPYWASNAFVGLLLAADHPVWVAREEAAPVEQGDFTVALPTPGFLVRGTQEDGLVRVSSHRSDHFPIRVPGRRPTLARRVMARLGIVPRRRLPAVDDAHYRKLAYTTHTAPDTGGDADRLDTDSQLSLLGSDGSPTRRVRFSTIAVADRFAASVCFPSDPNLAERIETVSIARGAAEIRIHHVSTERAAVVRDGGFALAAPEPPGTASGDRWSLARRDASGLTSFIAGLYGFEESGVQQLEGVNAFGRYSTTPWLRSPPIDTGESVFVSLVVVTGVAFDVEDTLASVEGVDVNGRRVVVTCRDGERFLVQLVAPEEIDTEIGGSSVSGRVRFARHTPGRATFVLAE